MSYTADADLLTLMSQRTLTQLTSDDPLATEPDWAVVGEARAYADAQVDARLRQRYALPLTQAPRELRDWALALARRWLYERRLDGAPLPEIVRDAALEALRALDAIRDGKLSLATTSNGQETPVPDPGRLQVSAPTRLFDRDTLDLY
jgi:phage gp36-like protein